MRTSRRWLPVPILALSLSAAHAETLLPEAAPEDRTRLRLSSKDLRPARGPAPDAVGEPRDGIELHLAKGAGFEVRRPVRVSDRELVFGVKGPLMKRNRLGLAFEVRF